MLSIIYHLRRGPLLCVRIFFCRLGLSFLKSARCLSLAFTLWINMYWTVIPGILLCWQLHFPNLQQSVHAINVVGRTLDPHWHVFGILVFLLGVDCIYIPENKTHGQHNEFSI